MEIIQGGVTAAKGFKAAGMNAHLSKPLDFEELFRTIKRYGGAGGS